MNLIDYAKQKGINFKLPIPYFGGKPFFEVKSDDVGKVFAAFELGNGRVLSFEHNPNDYPASSYMIHETEQEFIECVRTSEWIQDELEDGSPYRDPNYVNPYLEDEPAVPQRRSGRPRMPILVSSAERLRDLYGDPSPLRGLNTSAAYVDDMEFISEEPMEEESILDSPDYYDIELSTETNDTFDAIEEVNETAMHALEAEFLEQSNPALEDAIDTVQRIFRSENL